MSSNKRKIGYHILKLRIKGTNNYHNPRLLFNIFDYLCAKFDDDQRTLHIKHIRKSFLLLSAQTSRNKAFWESEVTMASGKLFHRPLLRKFETAQLDQAPNYQKVRTRENPKNLVEGEEERTHLLLRQNGEEIVVLFEERQSLTFNFLLKYIDYFSVRYHAQTGTEKDYVLEHEIIPTGNFLDEMQHLRVQMGEVYTEKALLGSLFLGKAERIDGVSDYLILTLKAKKGDSIARVIRNIFNFFATGKSQIKKIRIKGFNERNEEVRLDTDSIKRIDWVEVDLDPETGTIRDPAALFDALHQMLNDFWEQDNGENS